MNMVLNNFGLPPGFANLQPRVFVRGIGSDDYVEIAGVTSFERTDDAADAATIGFSVAERQSEAVTALLHDNLDMDVEVKIEFMLGMLLVMTFFGIVDQYADNAVRFALSTSVTTEVLDVVQ